MPELLGYACADCGDVLDLAHLNWYFARALCALCLHTELDVPKRDAEIWILERMFTSRPIAAVDPHADSSTGTPSTRVRDSS